MPLMQGLNTLSNSVMHSPLSLEQRVSNMYYTHSKDLWQRAYRMTGSSWIAEESVQDVFLKVWQHRHKLHEIKDTRAWLYVIHRRVVLDYIFRLCRQRKLLEKQTANQNSLVLSEDSRLEPRCEKLMTGALRSLSLRQREAYQLRYALHFNHDQIATLMKISPVTAAHHIKASASLVKQYILRELEMVA